MDGAKGGAKSRREVLTVRVEHMLGRTGRPIVDQVVVFHTPCLCDFFSYGRHVVQIRGGQVTLDPRWWNYSRTTGKYRAQFLGEDTATTQAKIDAGEYTLAELD